MITVKNLGRKHETLNVAELKVNVPYYKMKGNYPDKSHIWMYSPSKTTRKFIIISEKGIGIRDDTFVTSPTFCICYDKIVITINKDQ